MNKKLAGIAIIFILLILCAGGIIMHIYSDRKKSSSDSEGNYLAVEVNEIKNRINSGDTEGAIQKCDELVASDQEEESENTTDSQVFQVFLPLVISIIGVLIMLLYLNSRILKPFEDMKDFATEVSKGNMDASLKMDRGNYFGDFTWAFENMRKEIVKSRNAEKTAIENNKTVIATLSHDIKTPMASIRAYAEAFEANMDSTPEKRQKYLNVLMQKCDEVSKLTNDLFLHSISEMNRLEVTEESIDLIRFLDEDVRGLFAFDDKVDIIFPEGKRSGEDSVVITADPKRLLQIMENLKSNSEKYAKTNIEISLELQETADHDNKDKQDNEANRAIIHFRDFGPGIPEEEIPFITGKFYRGKNCGNENGSGLGLYIVKDLVEKMQGKLNLYNRNPGLDVVIELKI